MDSIKFVDILKVDAETKEKVRLWRNKDRVRKCMLRQHVISEKEHAEWHVLFDIRLRDRIENRRFSKTHSFGMSPSPQWGYKNTPAKWMGVFLYLYTRSKRVFASQKLTQANRRFAPSRSGGTYRGIEA